MKTFINDSAIRASSMFGYQQGKGMQHVKKWLAVGAVVGLGTLAVAGQSVAGSQQEGHSEVLALSILKNLEVNTFNNSLRPKHYPDGTILGQTPWNVYQELEGQKGAYSATDEERSWVYSVRVMSKSSEGVSICFIDQSLQGSYLSASPLRVKKNSSGHYVVTQKLPAVAACTIARN